MRGKKIFRISSTGAIQEQTWQTLSKAVRRSAPIRESLDAGKHLLRLGRLGTAHRLADLRQKAAQAPQESGDRGIDMLSDAYRPDVGEQDKDNNIAEQNANHAVPGRCHVE